MADLEGRVALVSGASRGIGRAIAAGLAADGADIVVNYRRDESAAQETASAVEDLGRRALVVQASVDDPEQVAELVRRAVDAFDFVDILVHNAGIASSGALVADTDPAELERVVAVHAFAAHHLARLVLPTMRTRERGDIVLISSLATDTTGAGTAPYTMGKAALEALGSVLAKEEAGNRIRVNTVAAGLVSTEMGDRLVRAVAGESDAHALDEGVPLGRVSDPEDVANAVRFLVSDRAAQITGQRLLVDGGGSPFG